jgi:uncharacterized membrane protein
MNNFGEQINLIIDNLSKKLGVAADKIYPVLMKQAQCDLIIKMIWLGIGILLLITSVILTVKIVKSLKNENGSYYKDFHEEGGIGTTFSIIGIVLLYILSIFLIIFTIQDIVQIVINPDYYIFNHYIQPLINPQTN